MANNFITNSNQQKTLRGRVRNLIEKSKELKFLVGFYYFSGWKEIYVSLSKNEEVNLKLLVGLQVDRILEQVVEHEGRDQSLSNEEIFDRFMMSLNFALNNKELDSEEFYMQVKFFIEMIEEGRLKIRKTIEPNHSKLYFFKLRESDSSVSRFITGSSNLTKAGLQNQQEFNVEISDYGQEEAEEYFDELWEYSIPITEVDKRRKELIHFIKHKSQVASVTPYEAYALCLKTYLDLQNLQSLKPSTENLLEKAGYKKFTYQIDAVNQALGILKHENGVIIADVVGLGKSVIASLIAADLNLRGMVICPPGLMGDRSLGTGWNGYLEQFHLYDWEVRSRGKIEEISETIQHRDIDVIIVDEAHYFCNQDTQAYEALQIICNKKKVMLLTATPFKNSPGDIFSLLRLFIVPGKSSITLSDNLEGIFRAYNRRFHKLSFIKKNRNSNDEKKLKKAQKYYELLTGKSLPIIIEDVQEETRKLSNQIRNDISPVVIRRNRIDLQTDHKYKNEITELSTVKDPEELFYELSKEQSIFYDRIIGEYFGENGRFTGAIYQPFTYIKPIDEDNLDESGNRSLQQQRNLFGFMRRLLVKRFESSFGSFNQSITRFLEVHHLVKEFINESGGKYILHRDFLEKMEFVDMDEEEIDDRLNKFIESLKEEKRTPKNTEIYDVNQFKFKRQFLNDIDSDIKLFEEIIEEMESLDLVSNDPKSDGLIEKLDSIIHSTEEPKRKVVIFSEYTDTVKHLAPNLRNEMGERLLVCDGSISKKLSKQINQNFNAQHKGIQVDKFDVLLTSDKLAEGYNLNRAGAIINYDIPWNPTKVIQRVGRINRIGAKVFDELHVYNYFPSEKGANIVKSKEIARNKMFVIHNVLGEDAKIFDSDETPSASALYNKVNQDLEKDEELNTITKIRNAYDTIKEEHPDVIEKINQLPARVKSSKKFKEHRISVLRKKGLSLFVQELAFNQDEVEIENKIFEELLPTIECAYTTAKLPLSDKFWDGYESIKMHTPVYKSGRAANSIEHRALTNLKVALKIATDKESHIIDFIHTLINDIKNYHLLGKQSLRRIAEQDLNKKMDREKFIEWKEEVVWLKRQFGEDYLEVAIEKAERNNTEVIIAVENQV